MNNTQTKNVRILSIAPSTRGFGFALIEQGNRLVDWGVKSVKGNKNAGALKKATEMLAHYRPDAMVLPEIRDSRRALRIRKLIGRLTVLSRNRGIKVILVSKKQVQQIFFANGKGTKYSIAQLLAERFPDELADLLPPKRKPWMSEDRRMDIFEAVAIGLAYATRTEPERSRF